MSNAAMAEDHGHEHGPGHDHGHTPMLELAAGQDQEVAPVPPGGVAATGPVSASGTGDLVVSADPAHDNPTTIAWFEGRIKAIVEPWGMSLGAGAVHAAADAGGEGVKGLVLDWDTAWGDRPATTALPSNFAPVDAKVAAGAAKGLAGYTALPAEDQGRVTALLGGETNKLSSAARGVLRPAFLGLKTATAEAQGKALTDLYSDKAAKPQVLYEVNTSAASTYTLTGPTVKKDYAFVGVKADAEEWSLTFPDGQVIPIIAPAAPTAGLQYHTVVQAAEAASFLAPASRKMVTKILLNAIENPEDPAWAVKYNTPDFHSYMTAGAAGVITVYPDDTNPISSLESMKGAMIHETGHTWSYKTWGNDTTKGGWADWQAAMASDKTSVSGYAMNSIAEDVAETVQAFGATIGTPRQAEYRAIMPARFAILDRDFK